MSDPLEQDREAIRGALRQVTPPGGVERVVLTRWLMVAEYVAGDGERFCRIDSGDHDDLALTSWDQMGLLSYATEKARQQAWMNDGYGESDEDEPDEE